MPALSGEAQFGKTPGEEPFVCSYQKAIDLNPLSPTTEQRRTKREHVIDEIISTELSYVKDLSQIIEVCVSVSLCAVCVWFVYYSYQHTVSYCVW